MMDWQYGEPKNIGEAICYFTYLLCKLTNEYVNVERVELNAAGWDAFIQEWPDAALICEPRIGTIAGNTVVARSVDNGHEGHAR